MIPLHPAKPTGTYTNTDWFRHSSGYRLRILVFPGSISTWRPCSASNLHHLSSCCFPTSPSWAPVSHWTSPRSRVTNVQEAPRQNGFRSVDFAAVMNPFEFSPDLIARRSYLSSLRCPRFPSGHSRAQCPSLRHLAHLVRSFQLFNAGALHARSLSSATCTSSATEETSGHLRNIEILSDGPVPRVSESWSSLQ